MLALILKGLAILHLIAVVGLVYVLQSDRFERQRKQAAYAILGIFCSGLGLILWLEEIEPFIFENHSNYMRKAGGPGGGSEVEGENKPGSRSGGGSAGGSGGGGAAGPASGAEGGASYAKRNSFQDCEECPMVSLPKGTYDMGAREGEAGAEAHEYPLAKDVRIRRFAISRYEITREQYQAFVKATGHNSAAKCTSSDAKKPASSFVKPGFEQSGWHPVVCVSWNDAQAYVAWLSKKTAVTYRLPSASEWEFAARAGTATPYHFGSLNAPGLAHVRLEGQAAPTGTAPAGSYPANAFGLHDMHGNAAEMVEDCWLPSLEGMPKDNSAWTQKTGCARVVKGGAWDMPAPAARAAARGKTSAGEATNSKGFRVVREIE